SLFLSFCEGGQSLLSLGELGIPVCWYPWFGLRTTPCGLEYTDRTIQFQVELYRKILRNRRETGSCLRREDYPFCFGVLLRRVDCHPRSFEETDIRVGHFLGGLLRVVTPGERPIHVGLSGS